MKRITKEQLSKLTFLRRNRNNPVLDMVNTLEIGEILRVEKKEWEPKTPLSMGVNNFGRGQNKKFSTQTLIDNKGYIIIRIK